MTKIITFHSYKGAIGKTTIASNLSAFLVKSGFNVCLLDFDFYDPNLSIYFEKEPVAWINDYFSSEASVTDILNDLTPLIHNYEYGQTNNGNNDDKSNLGMMIISDLFGCMLKIHGKI